MTQPTQPKTPTELSVVALSVLVILRAATGDMGQLIEYFPEQPLDELADILDDLASRDLVIFDDTTGRWLCSCHGMRLLQSDAIVVWRDSSTSETREGTDQ